MSLSSAPGQVSLTFLSHDMDKGFSLLADLLVNAEFKKAAVERTREQILSDIKDFWGHAGTICRTISATGCLWIPSLS